MLKWGNKLFCKKFHFMFKKWGILMMEEVRSLYKIIMEGLKIDPLNEGIINIDGIYSISIIIIISLTILVVYLKKLVD